MKKLRRAIVALAVASVLMATPFSALADEPTGSETLIESSESEVTDEEPPTKEEEPTEEEDPTGEEDEETPIIYSLNTSEHVVYISGSDDRFRPDDGITRAETARILYGLLENYIVSSDNKFTDVPSDAWYSESVNTLANMGIINGYGDEFKPENLITRTEFVTLLSKFYEKEPGNTSFADVTDDHWAFDAIMTGAAKGWISGYPDGTFRPDGNLTRAEAVVMLNRVLGRQADRDKIDGDGKILLFTDLDYSHWAYYNIMEAAVSHSPSSDSEDEVWDSYYIKQAEHAPGYHIIDGDLYCVSTNGFFVKSETDGVLDFDETGKYTSGNSELDSKLKNIVLTYGNGDDRYDSLYRLYKYVCNNYRYRTRPEIDQNASGWETDWALEMVNAGNGNCYSYAAIFTMLARRLGYQATAISGEIRTDSWDWDRHGWTEITLGDDLYFCDPEFEGIYVKNHGLGWDLFMQQYGSTPTQYRVYIPS